MRSSREQLRIQRIKQLSRVEKKLVCSCKQIILLNDKIRGLTNRYNQAKTDGYKSFRYNLRVRIATVEGARNMYYEYARIKAEEVADLRKELFNQNVLIISGSNTNENDGEDELGYSDDDEYDDDEDEDDDEYDDEELEIPV